MDLRDGRRQSQRSLVAPGPAIVHLVVTRADKTAAAISSILQKSRALVTWHMSR